MGTRTVRYDRQVFAARSQLPPFSSVRFSAFLSRVNARSLESMIRSQVRAFRLSGLHNNERLDNERRNKRIPSRGSAIQHRQEESGGNVAWSTSLY